MARPRSRRDRPGRGRPRPAESPRRYSALWIRRWVDEYALEDEALHCELRRKTDLIDRAMRRTLCALGEDLAPPTEYPSDQTPPTPALYAVPASRLTTPEARRQAVGYVIAGDYWVREPYRGRPFPRMVWSGEIWDLASPARIHVLDLDRQLLEDAYRRSPLVTALQRGGRQVRRFADLTLAALEQEAATAAHFVGLEPVAASRSPYVAGLRVELVRRQQDGDPRHNEQERAHAALIDLDQAGDVNFTQERGCSASQLRRLLARYGALHPPLTMRRAHKVMGREWGCSPERIEALLGDARRFDRIQGAWEDYREEYGITDPVPTLRESSAPPA